MIRLGTVRVGTNFRFTMPSDLVDALNLKEGDYLDFYTDDKGNISVRIEQGGKVKKG
jgi:AbrB family looped-hinge helix DNA binding protein